MIVVIDTNIVASATYWRGKPAHCLEAWALGRFDLAISHPPSGCSLPDKTTDEGFWSDHDNQLADNRLENKSLPSSAYGRVFTLEK